MIKLITPNVFYRRDRVYLSEENGLSEIKFLFEKAVEKSNSINAKLSNETLLQLHSLYNQATKGDIDVENRSKFCNMATKAELDAWASLKGKSIKDAQSEYIVLVHELKI
jgi:acyl-CoA-binding protein